MLSLFYSDASVWKLFIDMYFSYCTNPLLCMSNPYFFEYINNSYLEILCLRSKMSELSIDLLL